jgi:CRP-like cAMP-binding protein
MPYFPLMKGRPSERLIDSLAETALFATLNRKDLLTVVRLGQFLSFEAGERILGEGELGFVFYLILDGEVKVTRKGSSPSKLGKGDSFGELSHPSGQPGSAEVEATKPTRCFVFSRWSFDAVLHLFPGIRRTAT